MKTIREQMSISQRQACELDSQKKHEAESGTDSMRSAQPIIDTGEMRSILSSAEHHADVGLAVTPMVRFRGLTQKLALFVGKKILYVSSFIVDKQRAFNHSVIHSMRKIADGLEYMNKFDYQLRVHEQNISDIRTSSVFLENILNESCLSIKTLQKSIIDLKAGQAIQDEKIKDHVQHIAELEKCVTHLYDSLASRKKEHFPDELYVKFENEFRGTRDHIKNRMRYYLPYIADAPAANREFPVLDIGCGRGEWLELLRENGQKCIGVDKNGLMISICKKNGLDVIESDCINYLLKQKSESFSAITAFHVLEHISYEEVLRLIDECVRVLIPGGMAIFETPNPNNILVSSFYFHLDPSHRNVLPSPLMKFFAENGGLRDIKILDLNPLADSFKVDASDITQKFNKYFYGPMDYALVGFKT